MIINEWDNLIVTDNVLTNLPISLLSSIPAGVNGMGPEDLLLISKPCEPSEMTDTGYMSYKTSLDSLSAWMYDALDINSLSGEIRDIRLSVDLLSEFYNMLCRIRDADPSVVVDIYDAGKFNPYVISAVTQLSGVITDIGGYRFADAMSNIFNWKKFNKISVANGYFDNIHATELNVNNINATNANITNLTVDGQPCQQLSVMAQTAYNAATKRANYFYFTYPG